MKVKKIMRFIAGALSICMLLNSNGVYVFASGVSENSYEMIETESITETGTAEESESAEETESIEESESAEETESIEETESAEETESIEESESAEETESIEETDSVEGEQSVSGNDISGNSISMSNLRDEYVYELAVDESGVLYLKSGQLGGKVKIPEGTKKIPRTETLFYKNNDVTEIWIPTEVEEFEESAFEGAGNLEYVAFENNETNASYFPRKMFADCSRLGISSEIMENLKIPYGIERIGEECFSGCGDRLTSISISSTVKTIERKAFSNCSSLTSVNLSSVEELEERAFNGCGRLYNVTFSDELKKIGERAFAGCSNLKRVDLGEVKNNTILDKYAFTNSGVETVVFSSAFTVIPEYAFAECSKLEKIVIKENGIVRIEQKAFENCISLSALYLPECVEEVDANAFAGCSGLKIIEILNGKDSNEGSQIKLSYDSFPGNAGMIVKGYGGNVEEWAGRHGKEGVSYESLYQAYPIKLNIGKGGTATADKKEARIGEKITLTVKPADGMAVEKITYGSLKKPVSKDFSFEVTREDIGETDNSNNAVMVDISFIEKGAISFERLEVKSEEDKLSFVEVPGSVNEYYVTFPSVWSSDRLVIKNADTDEEIGSWAWTFKTEDSKIVSVNTDGTLRALRQTIDNEGVLVTATLKANSAVKVLIHCRIRMDADISEITEFQFEDSGKRLKEGMENGFQTASYTKAWMDSGNGSRTFKVRAIMLNTQNEEMEADFTWSSANTAVAKVGKSKTSGSENTITVCGSGETLITATSAIENKAGKKLSKQFIVRVIDQTPIVEESSITFNPKASDPAHFTLINAYGGEVKAGSMQLVRKVKNSWVQEKGISVKVSEDNIGSLSIPEKSDYNDGRNRTFTDLYLKGYMNDGDPFYTKMPKISISVREVKPSVRVSGKINTFYNAEASEQGSVEVVIMPPKGYELDDEYEITLEDLGNDKNSYFTKNFRIESSGDGSTWYIRQNLKDLLKDENGKIINRGMMKVKCKGFLETKVNITVPTGRTVPSYEITPTKGTANIMSKGQKYEIVLRDKKTKETIELSEEKDKVSFDLNSSSDYFRENRELKIEDGHIALMLPSSISQNLKAVLKVKRDGWSEEIRYTFNISATKSLPKVNLKDSIITINKACYASNSTEISLNQEDVRLSGFTEFVPTSKNKGILEQAEKIHVQWKDGKLIASIRNESDPKAGTYEFMAVPEVTYEGTEKCENISPIKVKVKIAEAQPTIKLKNSNFRLNTAAEGKYREIAAQDFMWQNIPAEGGFSEVPDMSDMMVRWNNTLYPAENVPVKIMFEKDRMTEKLSMKVGLAGNYTWRKNERFTLEEIKVVDASGRKVEVSPLTFTVVRTTGDIGVSLSGKGVINVLDESSSLIYTPTVKNYAGRVVNADVSMEVDSKGDEQEEHHFVAFVNSDGKIQINVREEKKNQIKAQKYTLYLKISLEGAQEGETVESKISFTPKQTMPKLTLSKSEVILYQSNPSRTQEITLNQNNDVKAHITGVKWAKETSDLIREAYYIGKIDENGTFAIGLKNGAALKKGTYTLKLVTECENQLVNTTGTAFSVKVIVK